MNTDLRNQQSQWRANNKRSNPASEGELLDPERAWGKLVMKKRFRILARFSIESNGVPILIHKLLESQNFQGISLVGAASTLLGQEGLPAQCLWYGPNSDFDWAWMQITNILAIEVREDIRFRGGVKCVWLTMPLAEYALGMPHPSYNHCWESVLDFFKAPPVDEWPRHGYRPDWWPAESAGKWPGQQRPGELPLVLAADEELRRLATLLSLDTPSSHLSAGCLGHQVDVKVAKRRHNLSQLLPWELPFNGSIKLAVNSNNDGSAASQDEETGTAGTNVGQKRKKASRSLRRTRLKQG